MSNDYSPESLLKEIKIFANAEVLQIAEYIHLVPGFLTVREGAALYLLASIGPAHGEIVEIGSFQGKSTIWLGRGTLSRGREKVIAIDPHIGSPEHQPGAACAHMMPSEGSTLSAFRNNLIKFGVKEIVQERVMTSIEAVKTWGDTPVRALFIDGAHEYEAVESDFLNWSLKVTPGGIIAFHDVVKGAAGPDEVVSKYIYSSPNFRILGLIDSLLLVEKLR